MSEQTKGTEQTEATPVDQAETVDGEEKLASATPEELRQLLTEEKRKSAEYLESWQRSRADFVNLKRRTEIERNNISIEAREKLLLKYMTVVDDFERALQHLPENLKNEPWIGGVLQIEKKLKNILEQEAIVEIPAEGQEFDPRFHDAVQRDDEGSGDKDYVTAVYQKGYKLGDRVIRPAVVKVGRK